MVKGGFGKTHAAGADAVDDRGQHGIGLLEMVDRLAVVDRRGQWVAPGWLGENRGKFITEANVKRMRTGGARALSGWEVEVYVVPRGDGRAIECGWLVVPAAQSGLDFLVDAMADRLHDLGFYDVALLVDCYLDDHVADQVAREFGAVDGRIRIYDRIGNMHFVAGDWAVEHGA